MMTETQTTTPPAATMRKTKEFYDMMDQFERDAKKHFRGRFDRVKPGAKCPAEYSFYEDGQINDMFRAYMMGYAYAKCSLRD
jgi:hypothetical protein